MLDRKSVDNFEAELSSADDVRSPPNGGAVIYGIWIFEDGEGGSIREGVGQMILGCALQAETARGGDIADGGEGMVEDVGEEEEVEEGYGWMEQPPRFATTADTDFFWSLRSPVVT
ncbi:hypothetical protein LTR56_014838 [Elasticomyces elasticus]|nr:hypothetical protein LTR56_014838 [Elasticomyces elasticus]KAK3644703.1 hypothetical protein LTR22_015078 [Elasticomyces elasticus]KAK4916088.1 hypothetical protein LTR49_015862 [Elasticomyces elasticus]KAK5755173.1 hypothetical protein LTS12_014737 [Elasticomyces elasticus]